jgi:hypothetical protein
MSSARLSDALLQESRKNGDVEDVAGVDESTRSGFWELSEAGDGLLCGDEGAVDVDGCVAGEVFETDRERVVGW